MLKTRLDKSWKKKKKKDFSSSQNIYLLFIFKVYPFYSPEEMTTKS